MRKARPYTSGPYNARVATRGQRDVLLENEKGLGLLAKWNLTRTQTNTRNEISRLEAEMRERVEKGSQTTGVLGPNDCRACNATKTVDCGESNVQ